MSSILERERERARKYYSFRDLQRLGYCDGRVDLSYMIRNLGFPKPIKRGPHMSSPADYEREAVHAWDDARAKLGLTAKRQEAPDQHAA